MQAVWASTKSSRRTTERCKHAGKVVEPVRRSNMCAVFVQGPGAAKRSCMTSPLMMP